jgi:integrase
LVELSPLQVKAWRNQPGYVTSTRRLATSWLLRCLEAAVDDGRLEDEALMRISRQLKRKATSRGDHQPPVTALSIETIETLAEALPARLQIAIKIAAMSGLRISEVMGLTVDKIDFFRHEIYVHRQLKSLPKVGVYLGPTKTGSSYRTVPVEALLIEEIAAHLARFPAQEQPLPVSSDDRKFKPAFARLVTTSRSGRPYLAANFDHLIRRRGAEVGLDGVTFHGLRHHYASVQLAAGMPLPELAAHLGHANPAITLRVYSHFVPRPEGSRRQAITEAWTGERESMRTLQESGRSSDSPLTPMQNRE